MPDRKISQLPAAALPLRGDEILPLIQFGRNVRATVAALPAASGGGGDANLEFNQTPASAVWTITHNLNKYPSVTVVDSAGDECEGSVNHISRNLLTITFSAAFSGRAFLN